ncbi:hypothetical protein [Sporosarcina limicola]|uniref:Sigma-X negative effector n=1 Tax=Sporosarcina limicola TaxID=34101 RepID=A0A927R2M3_9BACL|nr:hypothetical protein [Sporosarcina limicola]MBE1554086.1 hypothetical protein [Sporosarcina limicola]
MTDKKWADSKIKNLLESMPDIQDSRSKSDILTRLKQDERLTAPSRKNRNKWMPALIAIAALLFLSLLIPSMLRGNEGAMKEVVSEESSAGKMKMKMGTSVDDTGMENSAAMNEAEQAPANFPVARSMVTHSAVYPQDIEGSTVFHLGLAGSAAESVPVIFVIPTSQIAEDFGVAEPTSFELYNMYASRIDEEALGFAEYHPYKGKLSVEGETLIHTLPKGHGYDVASGALAVYSNSLQDTFFGFKQIRFENEDGRTHEFDQAGEPSKPMELKSGNNAYNYYLFEQEQGMELLSSNFSKSYDSLDEALQDMKMKPNDVYSPLIPNDIYFEIVEDKGLTTVKFERHLDLDGMEPKKAMQMIEGMLLTGASFGTQLQFENIVQEQWNGFDFTQPLPIPIGPNPMPFILK